MVHKQQVAVASQQGDPTLLAQLAASTSSSSSASLSSSSQDAPFLYSHAKIEDVSPVDTKLRAKALRPPLTIKSFFKPKAGSSVNAGASEDLTQPETSSQQPSLSSECSQGTCKTGSADTKDAKSESQEDEDMKSECEEDEDDCVVLDESCKFSKPDMKEAQRDVSSRSPSDSSRKGAKKKQASENKKNVTCLSQTADLVKPDKTDVDTNCNLPATTKGKKRKSSQMSLQPKTKQARSLTVKSENKGQEEKQKRCPICDKKFDAGVWNEEINAHIDNCLIE